MPSPSPRLQPEQNDVPSFASAPNLGITLRDAPGTMPAFSSFPSLGMAVSSFPSFSSGPDVSVERTSRTTEPSQHEHRTYTSSESDDSLDERNKNRDHGRETRKKRKRSHSRTRHSSNDRDRDRKDKKKKKNKKSSGANAELTFDKSRKGHGIVETKDFYLDRRGDKGNIALEKSNRYSEPTYKRWGDHVLGCPDWLIDDKASRKSKYMTLRKQRFNDSLRGFGKIRYEDFRRSLRKEPVTLERLLADVVTTDDTGNDSTFIAFPSAVNDEPSKNVGKIDTPHENPEFVRKTADFNKRLQEEPHNLSLWLNFIALQDELAKDQQEKSKLRAAISEKKQSIYEKALKEFPDNEDLLSGYMTTCQETWEATKLLTKWDRILKRNTSSIKLWKQYLDFRQTNYSTFNVAGCIELYENCIHILMRDTSTAVARREEIMLHIFTRACFLLGQSGFMERAVALFQAMIEFTGFCPPAFTNQTFVERLAMFGAFWESEMPRIGEEGAEGWSASLLKEAQLLPPPPSEEDAASTKMGEDDFESWLNSETQEEYLHWQPSRSTEDEELDDPYRAVLFEDISSLMFDITLENTRRQLIYNFLQFLSVPVNGGISSNHIFFQESFLHAEFANPVQSARFWPSTSLPKIDTNSPSDSASTESNCGIFRVPLAVFPQTMDTLFGGDHWFRVWGSEEADTVRRIGVGRHQFIRNVLQQAQTISPPDPHLMPLLLILESGFNLKSAQKSAKVLLKTERMNLSLWNTYAQIEVSRGHLSEARKVYMTALMSYQSFPKQQQLDAPHLYRMLADLEFEARRPERALRILAAFGAEEAIPGEDGEVSLAPTTLLRARKGYSQRLEVLISTANPAVLDTTAYSLLTILTCYGLMEYLSQGLEEAQRLYQQVLETFRQNIHEGETATVLEEAVYEGYVRLLYRHSVSGSAFKPGILRGVLETALDKFPCNTIFLSLYGWNEARTKIDNRVRRLLDEQLARNPSHILWTFAIWAELHQRQTYNVHLVRSLFERALDCPSSRHSVSLWQLYIQFEVREGNRDKAKALFFRAIRECPWCKDLYMLPFRLLRDVFDDDELTEVITLMEEKELRARRTFSV
ncbi:uncharacterized protein SPPG_07387 [Spizellomyces punctatus DAOM BR117]|uniref:Suppressor of forked domain-containing protein n=1 Tax=Spizellomyces punctatus (strain DAOM BR117) TaxID=645134 RepID=A0A0L0H7F0_SPIPD|nr:uncharacterized protein SPPG_07387 [Spizellomyces punctatus DAOM BR117]KNC97470.1 hypothetical protein SPPG_07387 [Spizellomyces punctatus DAOM BR117]|eukprot:XP_016605510.1 hypothetical protein SPPG_07387 [Spizellomyces punctatus DAOM BR117]